MTRRRPRPARRHSRASAYEVIRLAGVFAHPDDDVYTIGGTLLLNAGALAPTLIFATNGGAGPISDPSSATRETLGDVRRGEQRAALNVIGFPNARIEWLGHPDYYLPNVPFEQLIDEVTSLLEQVRPHVVVSFGPDGLTSHHDHIRIGEAATEAFHRARSNSGSSDDGAFRRLLYVALARADVDRFYEAVREGGYEYGEEGALFDITGVPDSNIAARVDIRPVRDRKLAGILQHRTQSIEYERLPESLRWIYLDAECFVQAHPRVPETPKVRDDPFKGLSNSGAA
jgi:LmbE family N-acetylglucosaminyl deacetylase